MPQIEERITKALIDALPERSGEDKGLATPLSSYLTDSLDFFEARLRLSDTLECDALMDMEAAPEDTVEDVLIRIQGIIDGEEEG